MNSITWDELDEGQELPVLELPITWKTLMLLVLGTRDVNPYHHHPELAKSLGMRGPFVNTIFLQGLFGRFLTDYTGHLADFRSADISMRTQIIPGDLARVSGRVGRKWAENGESFAEFRLEVSVEAGLGAASTVVMALPSALHGLPKPARLDVLPDIPRSAEMPPEAEAELGKQVTRRAPYAVSEAQIMYFCDMVRDSNPLYFASPEAVNGRYGGVIAPPLSLLSWIVGRGPQVGIDPQHPDFDAPEQDAWPEPAFAHSSGFKMPGTTDVIVQNVDMEFGVPPRPGDLVTTTASLVDCSPLKKTRLGYGYFLRTAEVFRNQRGEVLGRVVMTRLQYGVRVDESVGG